jgi:Arc/MetJ-type ribon-helix-helix transcriptional regulator
MQKLKTPRYATVAIPVRLWNEISKIVEISGAYASEAEFVRDAVREKLQQVAISEVKDIPKEELEQLIVGYIQEHGRAYPSDIAADLRIPYFSVIDLINRLVEKGTLEPIVGESG